ncbi:hypothetical protein JVU11DRAFT_2029 [Chiua virens]|nr:hypothetical protein JVU11DRAFT_2029 [Chiua virens]
MSKTHQVEPVPRQSTRTTASNVQNASQFEFASDSTPARKKFGPNLPYTSAPQDYESARDHLSKEMEGRWVGAMPVEEFLDTFLSAAHVPLPEIPEHLFEKVQESGPDSGRYGPFIDAIKQWMPRLQAVNTSNREDTVNGVKLKTDISIYNCDQPVPNRTDFSQMELWVEFKSNNGIAFRDIIEESHSFTPTTKEGNFIRGQLAHYAGAMHSMQFRNFSFSMLVETQNARFLRWDPSGAIVTAAFNYRAQPKLMAEFLWRFDHLSAQDRGHDPTVKPADLPNDVAARVRETLGIKRNDMALYRYELPGMGGSGYAYGPKLTTQNRSLVSRCTRNQPVVWIPASDNVVKEGPWSQERKIYMKDTWRFLSNSPNIVVMPEHKIYEQLYSHKVPNIPEHVIGGDIDGGTTRTQEFVNAVWLCVKPRISPYQHYRLFHPVVGRPLYEFDCTRQLVTGVFHALEAHSHAFEDAKILHRDISAGNIILTDEGRGLLIDWELAKLVSDIGSRRPDRTGTWQFMSAKLLQDPEKHHELPDDLESFLHVLAWITLRYVPAIDTYSVSDRHDDLSMFDEVCAKKGHFERGGRAKARAFAAGAYPSEKFRPRISTPLLKLLRKLRSPFKSLYGEPTSDDDETDSDVGQEKLNDALSVLRQVSAKRLKSLQTSTFFLEKMKWILEEGVWPTYDNADKNLPGSFAKMQKTELKTTQHRSSHLVDSRTSTSRGSKRAASPTPEQCAKRCRTSATSEALIS